VYNRILNPISPGNIKTLNPNKYEVRYDQIGKKEKNLTPKLIFQLQRTHISRGISLLQCSHTVKSHPLYKAFSVQTTIITQRLLRLLIFRASQRSRRAFHLLVVQLPDLHRSWYPSTRHSYSPGIARYGTACRVAPSFYQLNDHTWHQAASE